MLDFMVIGVGCGSGNRIDHIIWAVSELEAGAGMFEEMSEPDLREYYEGRSTKKIIGGEND